MKVMLCASVLILAVLICGCTTAPQGSNGAVADTPNLLGNWTGTMNAYENGVGYNDYAGFNMTMKVTEQKGRIFSGEFLFTNQTGILSSNKCAGVIGRDGKTLTMVEDGGGHSSGSLVTTGEIELIYSDGSEPFEIAIDSLKKV
ncbi:hypothetical protein [Methanosphaerula subterraneus]|uniref:hypothetical protein n=1 Tax=Methanosphaerula subterraneus TaxID=3350244 RepID=UPI003F8446D2